MAERPVEDIVAALDEQTGAAGLDVEQVAAQEVDVPVLAGRGPGDVLVLDVVALATELGDGGVEVAGVPTARRR